MTSSSLCSAFYSCRKELNDRTGGPSHVENLHTPDLLGVEFSDGTIEELADCEDDLREGSGHRGHRSNKVMVARKMMPSV